jgi:hypothetical protein
MKHRRPSRMISGEVMAACWAAVFWTTSPPKMWPFSIGCILEGIRECIRFVIPSTTRPRCDNVLILLNYDIHIVNLRATHDVG